eukprot:4430275-Amphidinium_carterae.2
MPSHELGLCVRVVVHVNPSLMKPGPKDAVEPGGLVTISGLSKSTLFPEVRSLADSSRKGLGKVSPEKVCRNELHQDLYDALGGALCIGTQCLTLDLKILSDKMEFGAPPRIFWMSCSPLCNSCSPQ